MAYIFLFAASANAYERPEFTDGLAEKWHPGSFCIPCHYTIAGDEKAKSISTGCQCHNYGPKNPTKPMEIDMTRILDIHTDMVCVKCHVSSKKNVSDLKAPDFHRVMSRVACLRCHTIEDGKVSKPRAKICSGCHGADPHVVHGKKLEKICMACHGEFGERFVNKNIESSEKMRPPSAITKSEASKEVVAEEYTSIGEFISKIISSIIQTMR